MKTTLIILFIAIITITSLNVNAQQHKPANYSHISRYQTSCIHSTSTGVHTCYKDCTDCKEKSVAGNVLVQLASLGPTSQFSQAISTALMMISAVMTNIQNTPYTTNSMSCIDLTYGGSCMVQCNVCRYSDMCNQVRPPLSTILSTPNNTAHLTVFANYVQSVGN
jgi:hypothetical protein